MNNTCDRCHRHFQPVELMHFDYNDNLMLLCFPCLKIVLASLMALPLEDRVEHLQRWQRMWQESEVEHA